MPVSYPLFFAARQTGRIRLVNGIEEHEFETEHGFEWREIQIIGDYELPAFVERLIEASAKFVPQTLK